MSQQAPLSNSSSTDQENSDDLKKTTTNRNTLTVTDNRTGKTYEVPVEDGYFVNSTSFKQMVTDGEDKNGIM